MVRASASQAAMQQVQGTATSVTKSSTLFAGVAASGAPFIWQNTMEQTVNFATSTSRFDNCSYNRVEQAVQYPPPQVTVPPTKINGGGEQQPSSQQNKPLRGGGSEAKMVKVNGRWYQVTYDSKGNKQIAKVRR
ncbi:hypothetical protein H2200_000709 [Cladophialophora chaetospira]|uniref:Uncharacterized protein n=1 Tax=Cladophialophora chaetospira TaxID=386627 RepID=A0AA39CR83_9EURO|nr:hypothetical protein H2200_000709 [Cladophialophora chaetospira]